MSEQIYFTKLTTAGNSALNAAILSGTSLVLSQLALGDANGAAYAPTGNEAGLVNELHRLALASVVPHPDNAEWMLLEAVIPADVGGWWIREVAVYDDAGQMIAIANFPPSYKSLPVAGVAANMSIQIVLQVGDTSAMNLSINANAGYATQSFVNGALAGKSDDDHNHDGQYYTETEIDQKLAGKADNSHTHDSRYYTESEVDAKLAAKADSHSHPYAPSSHNHDDRYFTETEVNSKLADKADSNHTHDSRYYTETEIDQMLAGVGGGAPVIRKYISSATWSKPADLSYIVVEVWGGGAAGGQNGTAGGTTSFGSHAAATGGEAVGTSNYTYPSRGGVGTIGDVLLRGQAGGSMGASGYGGMAGSAPRGGGGGGYEYPVGSSIQNGGDYGGGGSASSVGRGHGGGGGYAMAVIRAEDLAATEMVVVGAGGVPSGDNGTGGTGGVIITEFF